MSSCSADNNNDYLFFLFHRNILDLLPSTIMPDKATLDSTKSLTDAEDILYQESILSKCLSLVIEVNSI